MLRIIHQITRRIQKWRMERSISKSRKSLQVSDFSIISQNCIGGVFYSDMNMRFLTPTINLYIPEPDFIRMVLKLNFYMASELEIAWGESYPIGILGGDVKIHFLHYKSCEEAMEKWNSRKKRINWKKIIILATDRDGFSESDFHLWKRIRFPKVLFTANKNYLDIDTTVYFSEYEKEGMVSDLIPERKFYKEGRLIRIINGLEQ